MPNLMSRIWRRIRGTMTQFYSDIHFSIYYAVLRVADELGGRIGLCRLSRWAHTRKDKWIEAYLAKELAPVVEAYRNDTEQGDYQQNAPIWICWWTGIETAPKLVQRCVESIYQNAGDHPVCFITKDNHQEYLEIPEYMLTKVCRGTMKFAHLADYIRVKLLSTYGGLWLDATIYSDRAVPEYCFDMPVFTLKGPVQKCRYISEMRWVTFCLGGWKDCVFYRFLADAFETYWSRNDFAIDYLFFDNIILMGYEKIPAIRLLIDNVPDNNVHRDDLQAAMNAALPASRFESILQPDTVLYKLSWREKYAEVSADGTPSVYAHFLSMR